MSERDDSERQMAYDAGFEEYRAGSAPGWTSGFDHRFLHNVTFNAVVGMCARENYDRVRFLEELSVALLDLDEERLRAHRRYAENSMRPIVFSPADWKVDP